MSLHNGRSAGKALGQTRFMRCFARTTKLVMKWKNPERVIEHIIDNAKRRSVKGGAFRA